jgi:hypothetical protein
LSDNLKGRSYWEFLGVDWDFVKIDLKEIGYPCGD